jgi:dienelactone hydrolase
MSAIYRHLGAFSDLVERLQETRPFFPRLGLPNVDRTKIREAVGFTFASEQPSDIQLGERWSFDGCVGEQVSWSVGFGPRTEAWILRPEGSSGPLPGVVALHDHGAFKFFGKEKIADGPLGPPANVRAFRETYYGGRAFANALAREGFVVLIHDVFLWGSRRFPLEVMPEQDRRFAQLLKGEFADGAVSEEISLYNAAAMLHENVIAKYCAALGTTLAALVSYEDRVAANYLSSRRDVLRDEVGCIGLSGGGCRAAMLMATSAPLKASVIIGMMSTQEDMLDQHIATHTWMFFPGGLSRFGDWPDLAALGAPNALLVQYLLDDELFPGVGMTNADARLSAHYRELGRPERYLGQFFHGGHRFDRDMQCASFEWLAAQLGRRNQAFAKPAC